MPTVADLHWRLIHAIPRRLIALFAVKGTLEGRFPPDSIPRFRDRMMVGLFLSSRCLPIPEAQWIQKRFGAHPNANIFRRAARRETSELCVHAVHSELGALKIVWIGLSDDTNLVLYEVFFPSLAALVVMGVIATVGAFFVTPWLSLVLSMLLLALTHGSLTGTRAEVVRFIRGGSLYARAVEVSR